MKMGFRKILLGLIKMGFFMSCNFFLTVIEMDDSLVFIYLFF